MHLIFKIECKVKTEVRPQAKKRSEWMIEKDLKDKAKESYTKYVKTFQG